MSVNLAFDDVSTWQRDPKRFHGPTIFSCASQVNKDWPCDCGLEAMLADVQRPLLERVEQLKGMLSNAGCNCWALAEDGFHASWCPLNPQYRRK